MNRVEITLQDIFWSLKRYFIWIVLITLVFVAGAYAYTEFLVTPMYETSFSMGVNSNGRDSSAEVTNNEVIADANIASTYKVLLTSQPVVKAVSEKLNGTVSASKVESMITATVQKGTMVINVSVVDSDPQRAARVANVLSEVAPQVLGQFPVGGILYSIETADVPEEPISPDLSANLTIGLILGLVLSCSLFILVAVLDTTVWREEDLEKAFNVPVLGSVPSMKANSMAKLKKKSSRR